MRGLRIVCTGGGTHPIAELAFIEWEPDNDDAVRVWDAGTRPRDLRTVARSDSTRPSRDSSKPSRVVRRASVEIRTRKDGGKTVVLPQCPRCAFPGKLMREERLRNIREVLRDTPSEGVFDVRPVL